MISANLYLGSTPQSNILNGTATLIVILLFVILITSLLTMTEGKICMSTGTRCFKTIGLFIVLIALCAGIYLLIKHGNPGVQVYNSTIGVPIRINF